MSSRLYIEDPSKIPCAQGRAKFSLYAFALIFFFSFVKNTMGQAPLITSITPTTAVVGQQVTIAGANFGSTNGYTVYGSIAYYYNTTWTNSQIVTTVPANAQSGPVYIQNAAGAISNTVNLTVVSPTITGISPTTAVVGQQVTITGTCFGATNGYTVFGSIANYYNTTWTDTQIVTTVPPTAQSGPVYIQNTGNGKSNSVNLTVAYPTIASISPTTVSPGQQLTITGSNFGPTNGYTVYGSIAYYYNTTWTDTRIVTTVPANAQSGPVYIQNLGNGKSNSMNLTVAYPTITNISPTTVSPGQQLTITGSNFGPTNGYTVYGSIAYYYNTTWTDTRIVTTVPANAQSGPVCIQNMGGGKSNTVNVTISSGPSAVATLSASSIIFSGQGVGTTSPPQTITLNNTGSAALTLTSLALAGTNASDFSQTNNCGASLAAGSTCTISVTFTPTASGARSAGVMLTDNAAGSPQTVTLSGTGTAAIASFSPATLTFANQAVNTASAAQTVTLSNTGNGTLNITGMVITGTNSSDFSQSNNCASSVAAGANCVIRVTFTPTASGARSAGITLTDNAAGSPQTVSLSGTGLAVPAANVSPASLTFASQPIGNPTAAQSITLSNPGSAALSVTSIALTGTNPGDFAQSNNCGSSVAAGGNCTISVTFKPTASGSRTAAVTLADNAAGSPQSVSLTGTGTVAPPTISSGTTASGTVGSAFSYQITATNAPSSYGATGLPAGLTVNSATGLISGTPTTAGSSTVTLSATNAGGTGSAALTLTIKLAAPVITSATTASGTVGSAFSYQITATNAPSSYGATGLPAGLTVNSATGLISGTPTTAGSPTVTLSATNAGGTGSAALTLTIKLASPVITSGTTASGTTGVAFSYQITATNAPSSYGAAGLPAGLAVNSATGLISGTPTAAGTSTVTLNATNSGGTGNATLTLTITLAAPVITSATAASVRVGSAVAYQIAATSTPGSYGATGLPAGLALNSATGLISGTPTAAGTSTVTLSATNSAGTGNATLTLTIAAAVPAPFVQAIANNTSAGTNSLSLAFAANTQAGNLILVAFDYNVNTTPAAVSDSQGNVFTPVGNLLTSPRPLYSQVYYAKNIKGGADTVTVTLAANASYLEIYLTEYTGLDPTNPIDGQAGAAGSAGTVSSGNVMTTAAGDLIYGYCVGDSQCTAGSGFTSRSTFDGNLIEDMLAGNAGNYAATGSANNGWTMQMVALKSAPSPVITSATTASGAVGSAFSYQITATNAPSSYGATGLPAGLTVNTATGLISGTPTAAGSSTVTLSATNAGGTGNATLALSINLAPPMITSGTTASGTVGSAFSYQITATNAPSSYGATGLPAGLTVNSATGLISGTPTTAGSSTVTLSATNAGGTGSAALTLTIKLASPVITSGTTASGTVGSAFSYQITATNAPSSYGATGLPAGLTVNSATGLISGTPTTAGSSTVTLSATNAGGTGSAALTLTIKLASPVITSGTTASGTTGVAFSYQITATNAPSSYGATGLPAGLTVNSATGLISGTPTTAGSSTVTLSATNAGGTGNATLMLNIAVPVPSLTNLSPASALVGGGAQTLTLNGTNFVSLSTVTYNGVGHAATFVNSTLLTISLSAADLAVAGAYPVVVTNPVPGGGASNVVTFTVIGRVISLSPTSLTFASEPIGNSTAAQNITVSNPGSAALSISGIAITGVSVNDFSQTNNCGASLAAGSTCTISVTFTPTASGARSASVTLTDNAAGSPQSVTLSGTGTAAIASLSPATLIFASQAVNTTSAAQTVTLSNTGNGTLNITGMVITGANSGDFSQTSNCASSVAAGANCTISVTFKPTATGARTAGVTLTDNAAGSPQTISLTGTGGTSSSTVNLSPNTLAFGGQPVDMNSASQTVTLTNTGSTTLNITSIAFTGANPTDFTQANNCNSSVAAGGSCTIVVLFTPPVSGSRSAAMAIADSASGSPQTVALSGTGTHDVMINWAASVTPGVEGYNIYRGTASGGESPTPLNASPISGTSFVDENVQAGQIYYYVITTIGPNGMVQSSASPESSTTIPSP